jgi:hypothetical protein
VGAETADPAGIGHGRRKPDRGCPAAYGRLNDGDRQSPIV